MEELTPQEIELIEAIRNFNKSKHNPSKSLEQLIYDLLEELIY